MLFVLTFLFKEKLWSSIALFTVSITALLIIIQALTLAKVATVTTDMADIAKVIPPTAINVSILEDIKNIYFIFKNEGNRPAMGYILAQKDYKLIGVIAALLLGLLMLYQVFAYLKDFSSDFLSLLVTSRIRKLMFNHLIDLPSSYYKENQSGDIISRVLNDINSIQIAVFQLFESLLFGPIVTLAGLITLLYINAEFTLILLATGVGIALAIHFASTYLKKFVVKVQAFLSDITNHIQQTLFGIDIIKIYNRQGYEKTRFAHIIHRYVQFGRLERVLLNCNRPINEFFGAVAIIGVMFYGANLIWQGELVKEAIFQFLVLIMYIAPHVQKMGRAILIKQQLDVYAHRLQEILNVAKEASPKTGDKNRDIEKVDNIEGNLTFKDLCFTYPQALKPALDHLNVHIGAGEFVAIVGASGSGKSTLIHLIPQLLKPTSGTILFDNLDYRNISLRELRRHISFVSQDTILFPGTIRENILYGRLEASEAELVAAAHQAHIHDFIMSREKGYDTFIGERGVKLSGGQKQRLCIARALLKQPKILLLDEATSALDTQSERAVQKAIENLVHRQTTIVIAHRLSTILKADQILVMEAGNIVERGNHATLLKQKGLYKKLYSLQFSS